MCGGGVFSPSYCPILQHQLGVLQFDLSDTIRLELASDPTC